MQILRVCGRDALVELVSSFGVLPRMLVLEITEHERVTDMDRLARMVEVVRLAGVSLALVRIPVNVTDDSGNVTGIPANVTDGRCCAF